MKIKITEAQFNNVTHHAALNEFETFSNKINEKANSLYTTLTYTTLAEILGNDFDLSFTYKTIYNLESLLSAEHKKINNMINNMPESEYDLYGHEIDNKIHDLYYPVSKKLSTLESLITDLRKLKETNENISNLFNDIKNIEV